LPVDVTDPATFLVQLDHYLDEREQIGTRQKARQ
jgi:hypothetical protein